MATWSRSGLSASTNGKPISITTISSPGTLLHLVSTATTTKDTLYLSVYNYATTQSIYNLELGGTTSDATIVGVIPPQDGVYAIIGGQTFVGATATGADGAPFARLYATGAGRISAFGYVDRAT